MFDNSYCTECHIDASVCASYYIFSLCITGITMKMANLWSPDCEQILEILPQKDNITSVRLFSSEPWVTFIQLFHAIIHKTEIYHSNKARSCLKK